MFVKCTDVGIPGGNPVYINPDHIAMVGYMTQDQALQNMGVIISKGTAIVWFESGRSLFVTPQDAEELIKASNAPEVTYTQPLEEVFSSP